MPWFIQTWTTRAWFLLQLKKSKGKLFRRYKEKLWFFIFCENQFFIYKHNYEIIYFLNSKSFIIKNWFLLTIKGFGWKNYKQCHLLLNATIDLWSICRGLDKHRDIKDWQIKLVHSIIRLLSESVRPKRRKWIVNCSSSRGRSTT